jgi:uncharacterized membrane protein YfcA
MRTATIFLFSLLLSGLPSLFNNVDVETVDHDRAQVTVAASATGASTTDRNSTAENGFDVEAFWSHWWIFPASVAFATVALATGVSGALFFSPFFMILVGLTPAQAIGAGLLTELFGTGNGLRSYVQQGIVDYRTAGWLLLEAVPAVIVGAFLAHHIDPAFLKLIFGTGLLVLSAFLIINDHPEECEPGSCESEYLERKNTEQGMTIIEATDGQTYEYHTCWRPPGVALSFVGALITGLISAGLPEISTSQLIVRCRIPPRVAIATSIFVLAITAATGSIIHAMNATPVWHVVAWSIPGVLVGGAIGTRISKYLPADLMENLLGAVFGAVGILVLILQVT